MGKTLEFFFDFMSPYAYRAHQRLSDRLHFQATHLQENSR